MQKVHLFVVVLNLNSSSFCSLFSFLSLAIHPNLYCPFDSFQASYGRNNSNNKIFCSHIFLSKK